LDLNLKKKIAQQEKLEKERKNLSSTMKIRPMHESDEDTDDEISDDETAFGETARYYDTASPGIASIANQRNALLNGELIDDNDYAIRPQTHIGPHSNSIT
jgi:hypothetical protein